MCHQIADFYSACRCLYCQHVIDRCHSHRTPG
ncbi:hypothetical protein CGRA01v4_05991 [Colletotrichum graminicola]|nr:hypothetical protein CGRA01v4_05991 [Colletotrichum graminicola]